MSRQSRSQRTGPGLELFFHGLIVTIISACILFFVTTVLAPELEMRADALGVAIWISALAIGGLAVARRARADRVDGSPRCGRCGYNLTGNVSGVCPECGERI